jgi:hypothetical protein
VEATEPKSHIANCILLLMRDANPLVSSAARDSCVAIASKTYNDRYVDFGPMFNAQNAAKDDSALLWEIYFEKKLKGILKNNLFLCQNKIMMKIKRKLVDGNAILDVAERN